MTYQEIVNRVQSVVNAHYMLADFGYGDLSDLKTRFENTSGDSAVQADYPYLFLNPANHQRNATTMTYNFNMIVMDIARGEVADIPFDNFLAIQSQCQEYIDDVLAALYYDFKDLPEVLRDNISYAPFKDRFQDAVAGMTCSLSIVVPTGLNACIAPIDKDKLQPEPYPTFPPAPTPTATPIAPTPTGIVPTPTPVPDVTQYLEVRLLGCSNFDIQLWQDAAFTIPATAICDYVITGTANGDEGTTYTGSETVLSGQHTHTFNLNPVLEPGECVASFTVNSATPQCSGVIIVMEPNILWTDASATIDKTVDPDVVLNGSFSYSNIIVNQGTDWNGTTLSSPPAGTYKFIMNQNITLQDPTGGFAIPTGLRLRKQKNSIVTLQAPDVITGWPTAFVNTTTVYPIYAEWTAVISAAANNTTASINLLDNVGNPFESGVIQKAGGTLQIYKLA